MTTTNIFQDWQGLQTKFDTPTDGVAFSIAVANRVWDPIGLVWVSQTQSGGGGAGVQYVDGTTAATPTGTVAIGKNPSNVLHSLALDASGNLNVNVAAGTISGGNAAASATGAAVPASAGYTGWNSAGNLVGVSLTNALPVQPGTGASFAVTGTFFQGTQPVSFSWAGLTDTQLRASAVPVSLASTTVTGSVAVTGPLTDTQLRASAVPVSLASTTVTGSVAVTGPLTDTQLRASAVPVSLASTTVTGSVAVTGTFFQSTQPVSIASPVAVTGAFFQSTQPVSQSAILNTTLSGTLTASDAVVGAPIGDGTIVTGASTAGSIVASVVADGLQAWTLLIKGYVSGTIYTEASNTSTNGTDGDWVEVKGRRTGTTPGIESVSYAMVASGYYRGNAAGFKYIRARLIGGTGPTIQWVLSYGQGATFLNSGLIASSSIIGKVGIDQTTPGTTNAVAAAATASNSLPAYTESVSSALSQTLNGRLRTIDADMFPALDLLTQILLEMRVMNTVLHSTLNSRDDLDLLRSDALGAGSLLIQ